VGHVLGIGTIWDTRGCMGACTPGSGGNVYYQCKHARAKFNEIGWVVLWRALCKVVVVTWRRNPRGPGLCL
jgi:hypothetical protein